MLKGHSFLSALPTKTPPSGETAGLAVTAPPVVTFHTSFPTDADRAYTNLFVLPRTTVPVASSIAGADNAAAVVKFQTCLPLLALRAKTAEADPMKTVPLKKAGELKEPTASVAVHNTPPLDPLRAHATLDEAVK
jgi:hypothetical protein